MLKDSIECRKYRRLIDFLEMLNDFKGPIALFSLKDVQD